MRNKISKARSTFDCCLFRISLKLFVYILTNILSKTKTMSYSDDDTDSECGDVTNSFRDSFACLTKIKSNTPRARFDVHFYPTYIQLIQFSVQKQVSNRYRISKGNVYEMLRLPYSNGKHTFFVVHLKHPIVGGNRSTTDYDFVVFNFAEEDYEEVSLDLSNTAVRDMFDEDIVDSETIAGQTIDVFESILVKIFDKEVTTPAKNYDGSESARDLPCTFWDNDEHFLYPLDDGFVNVWKYCQKLNLKEVKNVRFVRSQGRFKTFDFYIYPKMQRAIRRYNIGAGESKMIDCFFLEFKAIDQDYYDGLFAYCDKNEITISTNDFRESASDTDDSNDDNGSDSRTQTETNVSESDAEEQLIAEDFVAPDPYMAQCETEGREASSETESSGTSENEASSTSSTSQEVLQLREKKSKTKPRRRIIIADESSSSDSDCFTAIPRKRSLRINSDDESPDEVENKVHRK